MSTSLGDQGSQVRVLSPRFAAVSNAVKPAPADCNEFQVAGIHAAGTSTHFLIDMLSCKTSCSAPLGVDQEGHRGSSDRQPNPESGLTVAVDLGWVMTVRPRIGRLWAWSRHPTRPLHGELRHRDRLVVGICATFGW